MFNPSRTALALTAVATDNEHMASRTVSEAVGTATLVVVEDVSSADPLLEWGAYEADRRHGGMCVLSLAGASALDPVIKTRRYPHLRVVEWSADLLEGIRAEEELVPGAMIVVGPLDESLLVDLVFGLADDGFGGPVVVVPRSAWLTRPSRTANSRLTVGFHGSGSSLPALRWAVAEATRRDAEVRAVLAWSEGPYGGIGGPVPIDLHRHERAGAAAKDLAVATLTGAGLPMEHVTAVARRGYPSRVLIHEAAGSELLIVGAGGSVLHRHRLLGAATIGCTRRSPVPVAIVSSAAA